ncbi:MAG: cupin domain-containing protein [Lachnospiraceae bacterium]|nr:cupin domain-containing protein [Candidatus Darwinimomas equi]
MIRKAEDCNKDTRVSMRGGQGEVHLTALATKEELLNHARMHSVIELPAGSGIGYHEHAGETEIFYILEGEPVYSDNGTEVTLHAGDVAICPPGEGHSISNNTESAVRMVATIVVEK